MPTNDYNNEDMFWETDPDEDSNECPECNGDGFIRQGYQRVNCNYCDGKGCV